MKLNSLFEKLKPVDYVAICVVAIFLLFPMPVPASVVSLLENPVVLIIIMVGVLYLFFYHNPLIAILLVFFLYETFRRVYQGAMRSKTSLSSSTSSGGGGGGDGGGDGGGNNNLGNNNIVTKANRFDNNGSNNSLSGVSVEGGDDGSMTTVGDGSLEVDVISKMAPINVSPDVPNAPALQFEPAGTNVHNAQQY